MTSSTIPCCVDVPRGAALVRYGLEELLRGVGLTPRWTTRDGACLSITCARSDEPTEAGEVGLALRVRPSALRDLGTPRVPEDPARLRIDGEPWPVPVGAPGPATLGDAVAGAAWWLAGIQERAVEARDRHGRFPYAASLQARLGDAPGGALHPAVDAYRRALGEALRRAGVDVPGRTWGGMPWAVALTHDLDAVRTRRVRAFAGSLRAGRPSEAVRRALGPDRRRDSIGDLYALGQRHGADATWFVKPGAWTPEDLPGGLDPALVRRLSEWADDGAEVGWHPGYGVHGHPDRWAAERERFVGAFGHPARLARTHFLRWTEPDTPRTLGEAGVQIDSTMGFAEHSGYRRGTTHPFRVFDPERAEASDLWEMPLAVMDTTLHQYRALSGPALADAIGAVFEAARRSGGCAVVLWHNQTGGDTEAWRSRLDALDHALGQARLDGAALGPLGPLFSGWIG